MNSEEKANALALLKNKMVTLETLLEKSIKCVDYHKETIEQEQKLRKENEELKLRLQEVQSKHKTMLWEQLSWQRKLDAVEKDSGVDLKEALDNSFVLLGYRLTELKQLEGNAKQVTLHYNEYCYIKYKHSEHFELLEINPMHPNFVNIKQFLHNTQDMQGLLAILRKFFTYAMILKLKNNS